jgi:glycosyltransferase involved in cell wall biosynthesis
VSDRNGNNSHKVLFVGRGRLTLPLAPWLAKKWEALGGVFDLRVLNAGSGQGDLRFRLLPDDAFAFYSRLTFEINRSLRTFPAAAIIASDPYIGAAALVGRRLARTRTKVIVEVHGDPRTFTRGYGSPARRFLSPLTDAAARYGLRHADATRGLSQFTSSLIEQARGLPATACFPTYSDLSAFRDPPLKPVPEERRVVFVAALEQYKNVDGLAAAWRRVGREVPDATLVVVGKGSRREVIERLVADMPGRVEHYPELLPDQVATEIDRSRALVLPSWPEGLGRVVLEAFARGRTTVATNAGGIRDIVTDGHDGILIPVADTDALVDGMRTVLEDRDLAVRLGAAAHESYVPWHQTAEDFARSYQELVERALAGAR